MSNKKHCAKTMEAQERASQKLLSFLEQVRIRKGEPFTHTTKVPSGSYYIGEDQIESFMTIYCNAIIKGCNATVTEKPAAYGPLRVDFDMKASLDTGLKRQYTDEILKKIVKLYQDEIKHCVDPDHFEPKMLWCIVLEKKAPRAEEGKVKDGFHLHFPFFVCEGWFQDDFLRGRITEKMIDNKIWEGTKYTDPVEKFIDFGMAKKPWLMYGSSKGPKAAPFLATKALDDNCESITFEKVFEEEMTGRAISVYYYMPRMLSVRGYLERTMLTPEIDARREAYRGTTKKRSKRIIYKKRSMQEVLEDIKIIKDGEIMDMLSDDRAEDYDTWIDVGWTLFNIGQGCDEALQLWIDFSKRSSKYEEGKCDELWGCMEMRDKTIASLFAMAKSDNPDLYKQWKDTNVKTVLYKSLYEAKPNEWDVAAVLHKLYKDRFLCADSAKSSWWEFKEHRWRYMDDGVTLKKIMATEVVDLYYELKADLNNQMKNASDEVRNKLERQDKKCREITTALKSCNFQSNVIKMAKVQFHDPNFLKKIDENKLLWGCENGVLDLEFGIFRDGRPDDYITFSCGVEYSKYDKKDDEMLDLKDFFRKVFPNPNLRRYFKDSICAAMEGGNKNKTFIISTGNGNNAKSVMYTLLEMVFGEYAMKFPREMLLTGQRNGSASARPELARVRGKRLAVLQEVAKHETLNIGVLKELTGNDSFFARSLFEKGTEIKPMFSLHMQCNEPPGIPGHDDATWNRVRRLDFESKFVMPHELKKFPVPSSFDEQMKMKRFYADPNFTTQKLPELVPVLLSALFERYKKYKKRGLREPNEVKMATGMYRAMNDVYLQFIQDRIEKVEYPEETSKEEMVFLPLPDLYVEFTSWYKETHSSYSKEKFDRLVVCHEFSKRFSAPEKKGRKQGWYGYKIIEEDEIDPSNQKLHQILSKQIEPKIKKINAEELDKQKFSKEQLSKAIEKAIDNDNTPVNPKKKSKESIKSKKVSKEQVSKAVKKVSKEVSKPKNVKPVSSPRKVIRKVVKA